MTFRAEIDGVLLDRMKCVILTYVDDRLAREIVGPRKVTVTRDWFADQIVLQLRQEILGKQLERIECKWPAGWWQAFKERWYPAWALCRWPVRYESRALVAKVLYPQIPLQDREWVLHLSEAKGGLDELDTTH